MKVVKKIFKRIFYTVLFIVILIIAGFIYQTIATNADKKNYPYPGKLVKVNGGNMHLIVSGKTTLGLPTVILIGGLGATSPTWSLVQSQLEKTTRIVAYDRAGYGWSDAATDTRDDITIAEELHELLVNAGIAGPYVIVAHSLGGLYGRIFTSMYPGEVKQLVLVESTHPDQFTRTATGKNELLTINKNLNMARFAAPFAIMRLNNMCTLPSSFPKREADEIKSFCASNTNWQTQWDEMNAIAETMQQVKKAALPQNIPLLIISAGAHIKDDPQWARFQNELSALSTNSKMITIEGASHVSVWTDTAHASKLCNTVINFITAR
ncbi:alpha/beta hydrolase [soil metagenome]